MFMVVRKSDGVAKKFDDKESALDQSTLDTLNSLSIDIFEETDYYGKGMASFNRIYEVYDGELYVTINDQEMVLHKGDSIFIEKGMIYEMKGTFKAIAMNRVAV
jgi:hypothetical protein